MTRAIIVDNEINVINSIELLIANYCEQIEIIAKTTSPIEAIKLITKNKPDLLFLDVRMPEMSGIDLLDTLPVRDFGVIFITSYDNYAIKAFRYSAIDYLLKPIVVDDFVEAVKKAVNEHNLNLSMKNKFNTLVKNVSSAKPTKLALNTGDEIQFIDQENIIRIEAEGRNSLFFVKDRSSFLVNRNLKEFDELLDKETFFRAHHSHIINMYEINRYLKLEWNIEMSDNTKIPLSRRKKQAFNEAINRLTK